MSAHDRELTRLPHKQSDDVEALHRLLEDTYLGHVAHLDGAEVSVTPTVVARFGDALVWHGSTGSPWMRVVATGTPVTVSVAHLEGVVVARSRFESSLRYRSAVLRGRPVALEGDQKLRALDVLAERILPGRVAETRGSTTRELAATLVLAVPLDDWVLKVSQGWPEDTPEDLAGDAWAGVVPMTQGYATPVAAPDLRDGIPVPLSVRALAGGPQPPQATGG